MFFNLIVKLNERILSNELALATFFTFGATIYSIYLVVATGTVLDH